MSGIKDRLTDEDKDVLTMINEATGKPQASDIADMLVWPDDTRAIHYRANKLQKMNLIAKHKQGDDRLDPVRFETTDLGTDIAADLDDEDEHEDIRTRMDRLEERMRVQSNTYVEVKRRIVEIEEELESHDEDLDDIAANVRSIQNYLEDE